MSTMINAKSQMLRGVEASFPIMLEGEIGLATDNDKILKGGTTGNVVIGDIKHTVMKTTEDINYYVNSVSGLDTNNGLTVDSSFKTVQHAIDLLPQVINNNVIITVASGNYDKIIIKGKNGNGSIQIKGSASIATTHNINNIFISSTSIEVIINGFNIVGTSALSGASSLVHIERCTSVNLQYINCVVNVNNVGAIRASISYLVLFNNIISNANTSAIRATDASTIYSGINSGSGNATVLIAESGSNVIKYSTQPSGTTVEYATTGGVIK